MDTRDSPYNENVGSNISLAKAEKWIRQYQQEHPMPTADDRRTEPTYATFFGRKFLKDFMKRWGQECVGLRIYQAIDDTDPTQPNRSRVVLVAVDKDGNDLLAKPKGEQSMAGDDVVADEGIYCPRHCSGTGSFSR